MIAAAGAYFKSKLENWDLSETLRETDHDIEHYLAISKTIRWNFSFGFAPILLQQQQQQTHF